MVPHVILAFLPVLPVLHISRVALSLRVYTLLEASVYIGGVAFVSVVVCWAILSHYEWPTITQQLQALLEGQWYTREVEVEGGRHNSVIGFPSLGPHHYHHLM